MLIARIEIRDHVEFGKKVVEWSLHPERRPATLEELKRDCADILTIPDRVTELSFVDVDLKTLLIRVPNKEMVAESVERFSRMENALSYPAPAFYESRRSRPPPSALDMLYSRVADYTIAQCA